MGASTPPSFLVWLFMLLQYYRDSRRAYAFRRHGDPLTRRVIIELNDGLAIVIESDVGVPVERAAVVSLGRHMAIIWHMERVWYVVAHIIGTAY